MGRSGGAAGVAPKGPWAAGDSALAQPDLRPAGLSSCQKRRVRSGPARVVRMGDCERRRRCLWGSWIDIAVGEVDGMNGRTGHRGPCPVPGLAGMSGLVCATVGVWACAGRGGDARVEPAAADSIDQLAGAPAGFA